MQVVAFALKERMLLDVQDDVQIPRWTTELSDLAGSGKADASSIFNAGRNFGLDAALAGPG